MTLQEKENRRKKLSQDYELKERKKRNVPEIYYSLREKWSERE